MFVIQLTSEENFSYAMNARAPCRNIQDSKQQRLFVLRYIDAIKQKGNKMWYMDEETRNLTRR